MPNRLLGSSAADLGYDERGQVPLWEQDHPRLRLRAEVPLVAADCTSRHETRLVRDAVRW